MRCRHGTAVPGGVAAPRHTRDNRHSWRADRHLRPPTAEIRREQTVRADDLRQGALRVAGIRRGFAQFADSGNSKDAGGPGWKLYGSAGVAGADDARDPAPLRRGDLLGNQFRELLAMDADLNDIEAALDARIERLDEIAAISPGRNLQYMHLGTRRTTDNLRAGDRRTCNDAGTVRTVAQLVRSPALRITAARQVGAVDDMTQVGM